MIYHNQQSQLQPRNDLFELIEASLANKVYWSAHNSNDCISTGWRVLPYCVVLYIREGRYLCYLEVKSSVTGTLNQIEVCAGGGDVMLIPAGIKHRLSVERPTVADGLHIQYSLFQNLDVLSFYKVPPVTAAVNAANLVQSVDQLTATLEELKQTSTISNIVLKRSSAYRLFYDMLAVSAPVPDRELRLGQLNRLQPALQLISEQLYSVKVEELASACALSRNGFSRLFKQVIGVPPLRYVKRKRMEYAMSKLVYSDASIAAISSDLEFCDQFHFSKSFRAETGETPSQYRANIRKTLSLSL